MVIFNFFCIYITILFIFCHIKKQKTTLVKQKTTLIKQKTTLIKQKTTLKYNFYTLI